MTAGATGPAANGECARDGAMPVTHSLLAADALARTVEARYDVGRIARCVLYRSYANDVYRIVTSAGDAYYLKVYRSDWRTPEDVAWELRLQQHLLREGVSIARPIRAKDRSDLIVLEAPEGSRAAVLSAEATGRKPEHPFTAELYGHFGRAAARLHAALDTLPDGSGRAPDDVEALVLAPARLVRAWSGEGRHHARIDRIADRLAMELRLCTPLLDWGVCHGDLTLDNVTIDDDGSITFFDFDLASASWRARDPSGVFAYSRIDPAARTFWGAFLAGYRLERAFGAADERAVPLMYAVQQVWDLGHELRRWSAWSGEWRVSPDSVHSRLGEIERWIETELV